MLTQGLVASLIPFIIHNSHTKAIMGCKMLKQSMGRPFPGEPNYCSRLASENKPLVVTPFGRICPDLFFGETAMVAIMPIHGFNQEDGLAMRRKSAEAGLFRSIRYKRLYHALNDTTVQWSSYTGTKIEEGDILFLLSNGYTQRAKNILWPTKVHC